MAEKDKRTNNDLQNNTQKTKMHMWLICLSRQRVSFGK